MPTKKQERRWFRVADSVLRERWTNDETALFLRLLAHLNTRRIRDDLSPEEAVQVLLGPAELAHLAGCQSVVRARRTLGGLAVHLGLTWSARGSDTLVVWPKVAETQGWHHPSSTPQVPSPIPTPIPIPRVREEGESERVAAAEPAAPVVVPDPPDRRPRKRAARARLPVTAAPETLAAEQRETLRSWCLGVYPALVPELPTICASTLDYWRGEGKMKADWVAVVRDRVRHVAERRGIEPIRPRAQPAGFRVDSTDPALGGQLLFEDEPDDRPHVS